MTTLSLPVVILNESGFTRFNRHSQTFGTECIAEVSAGIQPGETVRILQKDGSFAAIGYFNPESKICLRLLTRSDVIPDRAFWFDACLRALNYRLMFYSRDESFRVIFGEADFLPGLIVDKFGSVLSVQITTAGMERYESVILDCLEDLFRPDGIVMACDSLPRKKEGLTLHRQVARGHVPELFFAPVDGVQHAINCISGHKTGFFLDHRMNRDHAARLSEGKRVLDLFCYSGAFGIRAALNNAADVLCVDIFAPALEAAKLTAQRNGLDQTIDFMEAEAFAFLNQETQKKAWDLIFLDPPSFVKGSRRAQRNLSNYRRLTGLALDALAPGGILVTSCCSFHVSRDQFLGLTGDAFSRQGREGRIFRVGSQSPDHPILPTAIGTDYLKCFFIKVD